MKILDERNISMVEMDCEFEPEELELLRHYGLEKIKNDDQALISYAIQQILKKEMEKRSDTI